MNNNNGHWREEEIMSVLEAKKRVKRRLHRTLILQRSISHRARFRSFMLTSIIGIIMLSGLLFERMTATYLDLVPRSQKVIPLAFQHENGSVILTRSEAYGVLSVHDREIDNLIG